MSIEKLQAENARLKTEVEHLMIFCNCTLIPNKELQAENARLQAEVNRLRKASFVTAVPVEHYERLRKAGDAVALDYAERIEIEAGETAKTLMKTVPVLREWNAAKKGKPSV